MNPLPEAQTPGENIAKLQILKAVRERTMDNPAIGPSFIRYGVQQHGGYKPFLRFLLSQKKQLGQRRIGGQGNAIR